MAHFAQIDSNSIVLNVVVVDNSDAANEAAGIAFCQDLFGADTNWVQTSYSDNIRFRYAGIGMKYDSANDVFYDQQPYESWTLNTSTWEWGTTVVMPSDSGVDNVETPTEYVSYDWDEATLAWVKTTTPVMIETEP